MPRYLASFIFVGLLMLSVLATAQPLPTDRNSYNLMILYGNDVQGKIEPCG